MIATRQDHQEQDQWERELAQDSGSDDDSGGGSGGDGGYTGPRCYAPGGKTWTPC